MVTKPNERTKWTAMIGFFAAIGAIAAYLMPAPAYAQTSTSTMDMTPLVSVIVAIIPVFIMIALLDKLMGKFSK
jgi:NhaP-type Na+/H+ or K+/H+ antiporter